MKYKTLLFLSLLCAYCILCDAQNLSFRHLTTDDGLSNNTVLSIYQDEREFMWLGTNNGISLYNGKSIKIYQREKNNPNSLLYNAIKDITGDKQGHIYIMSNKGVSVYNIKKDSFTHILKKYITTGFYSKQLYVASAQDILKYNGEKFELFYQMPPQTDNIKKLYIHNDSVMIGTFNKGLYLLTPEKELSNLIPEGNIADIQRDRSGNYWIADRAGGGLYQIQDQTIKNFRNHADNPASISSDFVHCCTEDQVGNMWIGTFNGLNRYDKSTGIFSRYTQQENKKSLSHSSIWSLYCDKQGGIWIGTYYGGINYCNPQQQAFREYQASSKEKEGLSSSIVSRITEDDKGNLWMCTEGNGLNKYDPVTKTYKWYTRNTTSNSLSQNNIKAVYYDSTREVIWLGIHMGGLNKLDIKTGHITRYMHQKNNQASVPDNRIEDILPYQEQLLLATTNGIGLFDPKSGTCKLLFDDKTARNSTSSTIDLALDHEGTLWIANNNGGICSYCFDTKKLSVYKYKSANEHSISSNSINSIYEDSRKRLWFCTNENGLDLYRKETDDFENFDMHKNGLISNVVYNICELSSDKLLVTTDKGFSILDYQQKQFFNYENQPLSCIKENALYKSQKGEIFIGGTTGCISFYEKDLKQEPCSYRILPYRLTINGEEIKVAEPDRGLSQDMTCTSGITLNASQNIFSIDYTITDYTPFHKDEIIYRLEGFSDVWTPLGKEAITYTNLSPGKYTLVVKAKNIDEKLVPPNLLKIEVLPPFYHTTWAYLFYIVCILLIGYSLIRIYRRRLELQESLKYEKKHAKDIEQLNQVKLRFFTNISHEFRTPLTLIIGQMEILLQIRSFAPNVYNKILGVYKNSLQLKALITELLDFRKQEQGYMTIKVSEHNIVDFLYEHYLIFQEYALQRQITFNFEKSSQNILVWYDAKQMQKVLNNLISNAFKYTKAGDTISISVRKRNQEVIIEVTDTGIGIAAKDIDKIFDRFYQTGMESVPDTGTGIGLALTKGIIELHHGKIDVYSEPSEGSTFSIHLKTGNEHFTNEEICEIPAPLSLNEIERMNSEIQQSLLQEQETLDNDSILKERNYKILIVEDNESLRDMLARIFKTFYTVITASNGKEGLEKVYSEMPNIILSDIIMPEMSGTELCQNIKKDIDICHIPIVLLTAKTAIEHNLEGLRIGADDYITKPFNINILVSRCNNLVNNRIMLQEKFSKQPQTEMQILATNTLDKKFVDRILEVIEREIGNDNFSVDQLVSEIGIARTKLFTKLKAITGQTPGDLIMTVRLKRAAYLLKNNPELNITEISDQVGFNIPKYFSRCFKERYHVTPQAYRKGKTDNDEDEKENSKETKV